MSEDIKHDCGECGQPFMAPAHVAFCQGCIAARIASYDDNDGDYVPEDEWDDDCGLMEDGQCTMAGSEHCDFSCRMRDSEFFAGSKAWMKEHGSACGLCGQEFPDGEEPGEPRTCQKCNSATASAT